jgi:hypothetical protein
MEHGSRITIPRTNKRLIITSLKQEKILGWDSDNSYPQRMVDLIACSGVATRCVNRFKRFIVGRGFSDPLIYKSITNKNGVTMDKLLNLCANDYAALYGFAVHVKYNGLGQIIERNYMPFQDTRIALNGQIAYYNNWDGSSQTSKFNRADIIYLNRFNPSKVIEEINELEGSNYAEKVTKYPGQVLWYSQAGYSAYPVSLADPVAEDIETDYQAKLYKNKNIRTSFTSSGMYIDYGVSESENARFEKQKVLTEFQGADGAGNIMYVEVEPGQTAPTFTPFNAGSGVDNRFEYHEKSVEQSIVKCFAIPNILAGVLQPGSLATSSELIEAYIIYNSETEPDRIVFEEQFTRLIGKPVNILPLELNTGTNSNTAVLPNDNNNPAMSAEKEVKVPQNALNRVQINLLTDILTNVASGIYPLETGRAIIGASFPVLGSDQIEQILNPFRKDANG